MIGTLEAYLNGFRYSAFGTPFHIDVMYSNVKHAFFQDKEENKAGDEIISRSFTLALAQSNQGGDQDEKRYPVPNDVYFKGKEEICSSF
ncbi:hypothetical protein MKW92_051033, partial [Papaver armeniacum]